VRRAVLVLVVVLAACADGGPSADDLKRRQFAVTELEGDAPAQVEGATFNFVASDIGWGGICNGSGGEYRLQDGRMEFSFGGSTDMLCGDAEMAADDWMVDFLTAGPEVDLDGDTLTLTGEDATIVAVDTGERTGSHATSTTTSPPRGRGD
jgi:heat shock protein HslJ